MPETPARAAHWSHVQLRRRLRMIVAVTVTVASVVAFAIGLLLSQTPDQVRGIVTRVEARDIGHASTITIRDQTGTIHEFDVADSVDMTPGHLREHMLFGEPVVVRVRRSGNGGRSVAVRVDDGGP